jgi:DNA-binding MarR family transcriptional regulator
LKYNAAIDPRPGPQPLEGAPDDLNRVPPFGHAVGFLLSQLGYVVSRTFRAVMAEVELEPRHFALMRAIATDEGLSQNALVEQLRIPASSMVSVIDHLEVRGLVERRVHPADRRSRTLHVTALGREVLTRAISMAIELETQICAGMSDLERTSLIDRLQLVAKNLDIVEGVHPANMDHGESAPAWAEQRDV